MTKKTAHKKNLDALRKRYPQNFPIPPDELNDKKLQLILEQELAGWKIMVSALPENPSQNRVELFREYIFKSFDQVLEYMAKVAPICNMLPHHPRWENTWTTLKIYLSTWDSNHIITYKDIMLARHMEKVFRDYGETYTNQHSSKQLAEKMGKFIATLESLRKKQNLNEAYKALSQYLSQPRDIYQRQKIADAVNRYNTFVVSVLNNKLPKKEMNEQNNYFDEQLLEIIESLKEMKPKIFFSYARGKDKEKIVDDLYNSLQADNEYDLVRDRVDLGYTGLISKFMESIGRGQLVIVVLSDKYMRSEYCMFELYELYRNSKLEDNLLSKKIFPIRLEDDLNLDDHDALKNLEDFWQEQFLKSKELSATYPSRFKRIKNINNELGSLVELLRDINALDAAMLTRNDFAEIKRAIQKRAAALNPE